MGRGSEAVNIAIAEGHSSRTGPETALLAAPVTMEAARGYPRGGAYEWNWHPAGVQPLPCSSGKIRAGWRTHGKTVAAVPSSEGLHPWGSCGYSRAGPGGDVAFDDER